MPLDAAHAEKVEFLRWWAWPGPTEVVETHMSWVFLSGDRAYKMKKPVVHAFLDYRTLEARRIDCEAEVAVNAPLAPGVYLGTTALRRNESGALTLSGSGPPVEWLVVMRRLDRQTMLDARIVRGDVPEVELAAMIDHLAQYYRSAEAKPVAPAIHVQRLADQLQRDRAALVAHRDTLGPPLIDDLTRQLADAIESLPGLGERGTHLVEGHGDLRPEHVVLGEQPLVIDCVSFNAELRVVDPLHDLALVAVECELLDAPAIGERFLAGYQDATDDRPPRSIVDLYCALRALTRAHLAIGHLDDSPDDDRWTTRTNRYLIIASRHAPRRRSPIGRSTDDR